MEPVNVRDLLERPGSSREVHVTQPIEGLTTELARVPPTVPVKAELLLEHVVEGILVSGPLWGRMAFRCARCLKEFSEDFRMYVHELFAPGATEEDDEYSLADGAIDLEPMVRDAVMLSMPFSPLCRAGCRGLCERCGGDRNLGECSCGREVDPRWSVLNDLTFD
jgi:uncharacterized protein